VYELEEDKEQESDEDDATEEGESDDDEPTEGPEGPPEEIPENGAEPSPDDDDASTEADGGQDRKQEAGWGVASEGPLARPAGTWSEWLSRKLIHRPAPKATTRMPRIVREYADVARLRFGCPEMTEANRLAVRRYIMEKMRTADDLRTSDASRYIDLAVAALFVPTTNQRVAAEISGSHAARDLRSSYQKLIGGSDAA